MKMPSQKVVIGLSVLLAVLVIFAGTGTLLAYNVYTVRDGGSFTRNFGGWLPAAKVGAHTIQYKEFLATRDTLNTYLHSEAGKMTGAPTELTAEIEKQALNRLIREKITVDLAKEKNISVTDEEVQNSFDVMAAMNSSTVPDIGKFLQDNYHWSGEEFRKNVVKPAILEERVAGTYSTDTEEQWTLMEADVQDRLAKPDVKIYLKFDAQ